MIGFAVRTLALFVLLMSDFVSVAPAEGNRGESLDAMLQPYLARFGLPAIAAAVVRNGAIVASGAVGVRRAGGDERVTIDDRFHLGSDTKAMTSLLAAMLVESGKLRWNTTVAEVFPELAKSMKADVKRITLEQLLSHTSGIPSDNAAHMRMLQRSFAQTKLNLDELRYWVIRQLVMQRLQSKPGASFAYANMGSPRSAAPMRIWATIRVLKDRNRCWRGRTATIRKSLVPPGSCTCPFSISRPGVHGTPGRGSAARLWSRRRRCASSTRK